MNYYYRFLTFFLFFSHKNSIAYQAYEIFIRMDFGNTLWNISSYLDSLTNILEICQEL